MRRDIYTEDAVQPNNRVFKIGMVLAFKVDPRMRANIYWSNVMLIWYIKYEDSLWK